MYVADAEGRPLTGAAGQRRLLALLSALGVAGDAGLSRDRLVGLLWPDADEERARHSLTQALYSARRALGADDLFSIAGDIRLNRDRLTADVQAFETALDAGELERAAELYQGPFLDGFFLPGSSEFEQWSTLQRTRLEDRAAGALDRLADQAEADGDLRATIEWRKRLATVRPLDSAATAKLMTALAQAGDRAGAMRHARLHEMLLWEQLGLLPDPALTALAERLREPGAWTPAAEAGAREAEPAPVATVDDEPEAPEAPEAPDPSEPSSPSAAPFAAPFAAPLAAVAETGLTGPVAGPPTRARPTRRHRLVWALAALLLLVVAVDAIVRVRRPAPAAPTLVLRQRVVVAPFRVAGASPTLAYLRDGMVELLSARLADDSAARSVDAGAVLAAWRAAGLTGTADVPRDTVVRLAGRLGAERVVVGSVVGTPSRAIVNAAVVSVATGSVTGEATVAGPADSLLTLVDQLAARLLVVQAGEDASLASQTTESLRALRSFLAAQAAFRTGNYGTALREYERALQLDSTFALAALQLVRTVDRLHTGEARDGAIAVAWQYQDALSERDRAALVAIAGPRWPAPSTAAEQLAAWERLVDLTPDRADSWYALGERLFHDGASLGVASARPRAASALRHALTLDSADVEARKLLAQLAAGTPPERSAGPLPPDAALADSTGPLSPFVRWRAAVARADSATLRHLRDTLPRLGRGSLRAIAQASLFDGVALDDGRDAVRALRERGGRLAERVEALEATHALALSEGRLADALDATERLADLQPRSRAHLRLRVLDALYGDGNAAAARDAADALRRAAAAPPAAEADARAVQLADACVLAQWALARGDTTEVRRAIGELRVARPAAAPPPVAAAPAACAELLDASLAVASRAPGAAAAVERLDSLALTPAAAGDAASYAPIVVARLRARLGEPRRALAAIRERAYMTGWPRYRATMLRDEARYAAAAGEPDAAAAAWRRWLALRADPDPALAAQVDSVRRALGMER